MNGLYTSKMHLKRILDGLATAAFTPLTQDATKFINPEFVPGMGALNENDSGQLQCPVCGQWTTQLASHLSRAHRAIGGSGAVRAAIGIPSRVALVSEKLAPTIPRTRQIANIGDRQWRGGTASGARTSVASAGGMSFSARNFADSCPGQTAEKLDALAAKLGRSPSQNDFEREYGRMALHALWKVFGSWNNAKAIIGLETATQKPPQYGKNLVVESLGEWVREHGDLPLAREAQSPSRAPLIPYYSAIIKNLQVNNWAAAMRSAAEHLSIKSERYGVDFRKEAA